MLRRRVHVHLALALAVFLLVPATSSSSRSRVAACASAGAKAAASVAAPDGVPPEHLLPCLEELLPCLAYLKTPRHPSPTCCTAMNRAAAAEMPCLCRLLADRVLLVTFNVTTDQMFKLPARCGLPVGCRAGTNEPVVEAPPPPAVSPRDNDDDDSSSGAGFRSSASLSVIASVVLGGMLSIAVLF